MSAVIIDHSPAPYRPNNFTKARYVEGNLVPEEWQRIFRTTWLLAGLAADVRAPGDFFVFDIGPEQILVTRNTAGALRAFYNVCQHRGLRLVHDTCGNSRHFRCAYHAWTYDNDGALRAVPHRDQFPDGIDAAGRGLRAVHVDTWDGMVFVHLGAEPEPLAEFLGDLVPLLAAYRFADMTLLADQTCALNCNWKAVVDNFGELYHVDFLHPQHRTMVDCWNDTVHLFPNGHTGVHVPGCTVSPRFPTPKTPTPILAARLREAGLDPADFTDRVLEIRAAIAERKRGTIGADGLDYGRFSDDQITDAWQYNLFPNVVLSFGADHLWIMRARPDATDPGQTEFDKLTLGRVPAGTVAGRPTRDVFTYDAVLRGEKTMTITIDQDVELLKDVQRGMASAGFDRVWLSDEEARVQHFHGEWERRMGRA